MMTSWSVRVCGLLMLPLSFAGAATEAYTPPEPLSSVDALVQPQQDNGYGLGALIASQQQKGDDEKKTVATTASVSAAAAAARQAQSARRKVGVLQAEIVRLKEALAASQTQQQRVLNEKAALQTNLQALNAQMASGRRFEQQLAAAQTALTALRAKPAGPQADLTTAGGKQDYVVGQSIAASLRERLQSYTRAGLTLDQSGVLAGISDGQKGSMQMKKTDMDAVYLQFATRLQQQVSKQVSDGEALIAKKSRGRTPVKQVDGITYFVVKKGKAITDPDAPVMLSLTESIIDGRTVSTLPQLVLTVTDEMPTVVREALPLLGEGSEVQAYALAKSVYGSLPLPRGVEAFTVLSYDLKGLTPPRPAKK